MFKTQVPKLRGWFTTTQTAGEIHTKPSMTVPGQTLPLKTLLDRYIKGGNVEIFNGSYDDDGDIPEGIERMDPQDRLTLAREIGESLNTLQTKQAPKPQKPEPAPQPIPNPPAPSAEPDVK